MSHRASESLPPEPATMAVSSPLHIENSSIALVDLIAQSGGSARHQKLALWCVRMSMIAVLAHAAFTPLPEIDVERIRHGRRRVSRASPCTIVSPGLHTDSLLSSRRPATARRVMGRRRPSSRRGFAAG